MKTKHSLCRLPLWVAVALSAAPAFAADNIQAERERWALHARGGDSQLAESVAALQTLYSQSGDARVRADLTALLLRQGRGADALALCSTCQPGDYRADELENLAKAARDNKQFVQSLTLYQALQQKAPQQKIGWLGGALAATDAREYAAAKTHIEAYRRRFGNDADIQAAEEYLKTQSQSQSLAERIGILEQALAQNPDDRDTVLALYRAAAGLQVYPVQERLMKAYPQHFTPKTACGLTMPNRSASCVRPEKRPTAANLCRHSGAWVKLPHRANRAVTCISAPCVTAWSPVWLRIMTSRRCAIMKRWPNTASSLNTFKMLMHKPCRLPAIRIKPARFTTIW